ncbi:hypothetical protein MSMTP_0786 [Methanosarcina sp. MTP4]|uniref:helix-turn-helix transcriptional regulator n=1 Tax=Methanosarcina sp. MTP4 TaxID=1434100 RepID=UPI000616169B|nr:hypothetical protein [Methanosarcina sp. MTP4]AKB24255.1 hypothetical protein MSMTP_0786 [Methanosarcina sp. MTP4]
MNFKKLFTFTCILCSLLFVQGTALAATVHGNVYEWYSFEPLNNAVIEVNSTPEQYFVAVDAVYSFNLPPGNYLVKASYFERNTIVYAAEETVKITENGDYVVDLLLFPAYEEELLNQSEFEEFDKDFEEAELVSEDSSENTMYAALLLVLCILLFTGYFWKKIHGKPPEISDDPLKENKQLSEESPGSVGNALENFEEFKENTGNFESSSETSPESSALQAAEEDTRKPAAEVLEPEAYSSKKEKSEDKTSVTEVTSEVESKEGRGESKLAVSPPLSQTPEEPIAEVPDIDIQHDPEAYLPEDLKEVLELIRASGNRITQLELRKKSRYSESKVSLMLSDLEERGMIEKFKKGRGNIIRIQDEHVLKRDNENKKDKKGESS